ncbi:phosphate/phosphite/phosphonate ABC transporter substrate-binding protein [Magnetovibrio sp.]|uniref:phosphate/phosphite/phosphonate ABC transporter substrate-binding protein n=1 Tax=Magnetovibrio sp. TaxID=2024836 RepID=UPI002F92AAB3
MTTILLRRTFLSAMTVLCAGAFLAGLSSPVAAAECKNRGDLDIRYCDENGDLVADTPTDPAEWLDPSTLVFSYTPVEDPSVYENVFTEFMDYLAKKTGKRVSWYGAESYAAQVEAMRSGRLHVAGISTGPTVYGVNLAGYVPFTIMGEKGNVFGYKLQLITKADSDIKTVADMKGRKIAHVTPTSNSGNQAPRAFFKEMGVTPDVDYEVIYSGKHDNSVMGVVNGDYDAAPIASSVMDRMIMKGMLKREDIRVIWESQYFPTTSYGYVYNLKPDLAAKIVDAFLSFDWAGTALANEFKPRDRFIPITFKEHWAPIRLIQKDNGVVYSQEALEALKK